MNFSDVLWQRLKHQLSKHSIPQELQVPIEGNPIGQNLSQTMAIELD